MSPNAASLYKYTELPVNLYTGIPSISIPIYEIKSGNLSVPISVSYHAGGIRYEDQASWVGLGWSLQAGGAINRNIKGIADEKAAGILNQSTPLNLLVDDCDYAFLDDVVKNIKDVQPDEFSFSTPNKNGRFVFQPGVSQPITIPYEPLKINHPVGNLSNMEILDETGTLFTYGITETTSGGTGAYVQDNLPSTWLMTKITSADQAHNVVFNYAAGLNAVQKLSKYDHLEVLDLVAGVGAEGSPCTPPNPYFGNILTQSLTYSTNTQYLSEILFQNGKVRFVQSAVNRTDVYENQKSLDSIKVFALEGGVYKLIKSYKFHYTYFKKLNSGTLQDWKLKLDKVQLLDADGLSIEQYSFQYHTDIFSGTNITTDLNSQDYWGFYNGKANSNLIPAQQIEYKPSTGLSYMYSVGGDRNVDPVYMTEGVLKRIIYPTGGYTEFEFETHKYQEENQTKYAGGLRITKQTSRASGSDLPLVKTYKYGQNNSGFGYKNFSNYVGFYSSENTNVCLNSISVTGDVTYRTRSYNSASSMQIDGYDGSPVVYPYVTEYTGDETINLGKVEYVFDDGVPVSDNFYFLYFSTNNIMQRQSNSWNRGKMTSKIVYNKDNVKVAATTNTYQLLHLIDQTSGILAAQRYFYPVEEDTDCPNSYGTYKYSHNDYPVRSGSVKPQKIIETQFNLNDPAQAISSETSYVFDPNYLQALEVTKGVRKIQTGYEEQVLSYAKYPFNYSFTGTPSGSKAQGIKLLQDKNISVVPIEQYTVKKFKNPTNWQTEITAGTISTYLPLKPYIDTVFQIETAAPISSASFGTGSSIISNAFSRHSTYVPKLAYTVYDVLGNINQFNKVSDLTNTYLWDYLNMYPVAEVTNGDKQNIAYSSFEAENASWGYTGTPSIDLSAPTGKKVYTLNGSNNITKSGLSTSRTYIVSYWTKGLTPLLISGTQGAATQGKILGAWRYYEHKIANQTQVVITGNVVIDELRLYPNGSLMKSYTYDPLVGMTSQCDPSSKISYYEYDKVGRLQVVRDQDKKIIKTFEYKYKTPL